MKKEIELSDEVSSFVVSNEQQVLDLEMVPADIWGTTAHVLMLKKTGIITSEVAAKILKALRDIEEVHRRGEYKIDPGLGAQLTLEKEIVKRAGEQAGLSTHTARSRNDQVMVTELIYLRQKLPLLIDRLLNTSIALNKLAAQHTETAMPGYTHMQPGKPTTFAHWCILYSSSFKRVAKKLLGKLKEYDASPLGSVESFGTSWNLDRAYTAKLLGFSSVWKLPLDAISHRGYLQCELLQIFALFGVELTKFASDLLLYSTHEYGFIELGDDVAKRLHPITGSSVMAQKRNPDALELLRAHGAKLLGYPAQATSLLSNLPCGYNRDSRELKGLISSGIATAHKSLSVIDKVVSSLCVDSLRMQEIVLASYSLTTDLADAVTQETKLPYRLVYKIVGKAVNHLMEKKQLLTELTLEMLQDIAVNDFDISLELSASILEITQSPQKALSRRNNIGGTSQKATNDLLLEEEGELQVFAEELDHFQNNIVAAQELTRLEVSSCTG